MAMQKQFAFHLLVEPVAGGYLATCLETGFVTTDPDRDDVVSKMTKMIARTVAFAARHDRLADMFQPASNKVFKKYVCEDEKPFTSTVRDVRLDHCGIAIQQTAYAAAAC